MRPHLAKYYDTESNSIPFEDIQQFSNKSYFWRCKNHPEHTFRATACAIEGRAEPCVFCSGSKVFAGFNDLGTTHPHLLVEWSPLNSVTIESVSYGSTVKRWWRCRKGHDYEQTPAKRSTRGFGCPRCSKKASAMEARLVVELRPYFPDLLWGRKLAGAEIDILIPSLSLAIEVDGYPWHLESLDKELAKDSLVKTCGLDMLRIRDARLPPYPGCAIITPDPAASDAVKLAVVNAVMSFIKGRTADARLPDPLESFAYAVQFEDEMSNLSVAGGNSLLDHYPSCVDTWDYEKNSSLTPRDVSPSSTKKVWWRCETGLHSYSMSPGTWGRGSRCNICAGHALLEGFNDAATRHPELAEFFSTENSIPLSRVLPRWPTRWLWRCSAGHEWHLRVSDMLAQDRCLECSKAALEKNTLAVAHPDLFREVATNLNVDVDLNSVPRGSERKLWWRCGQGHAYEMQVDKRVHRQQGCPYCSGRRPIVGVNDLASMFPGIAEEWDPQRNGELRPDQVKYGSGKMAWWVCRNGHDSWQASITARTANNQTKRCPECKKLVSDLPSLPRTLRLPTVP